MRFINSSNPDEYISDLKYTEDGGSLRLSFRWPDGIGQVYIFKTQERDEVQPAGFDAGSAQISDARLFTLQEYKKLAGFVDKKTPGVYTYRIFPFTREGAEDILICQPDGRNTLTCLTGQTVIQFSIKEKTSLFGGGKAHYITLFCEQPVDADALCYVKKENGYPAHSRDGTVYFFGEALRPGQPVSLQVKTEKNEYLRVFIYDTKREREFKLTMSSAPRFNA